MKQTIILIATALVCNFQILAQTGVIIWQGKLLDAGGNAITQNNVAMTLVLFDDSRCGNQL